MILRTAVIVSILFISRCCQAQVRLAFFAGPQATSAHYKVAEKKQPGQYKFGFMAGAGAKIDFENSLYFFPSIYYSLKGYNVTLNDPAFPPTQFAKNNNTTIHTIEISPLFQIDLNKKPSHPFIRFGPAVDFAFSGRERFDTVGTTGARGTVDRSMVFSFGDYGRFSAQANLHLGYQTSKGLMAFAFYEYGFGSMNNADFGPRIFHRIAGISVGWLFNKPVGKP